ncbi:ankyrin repeat domain-containing protein [Comamonas sp.]|uniref:ankyrin repeat domain-containing protein n=1 Tax=Comamonas sp. TaxID=34028 RepID=UPI002FC90B43
MRLNIEKCNELLKQSQLGNIREVIELLSRADVDVNYIAKFTRSTFLDKNAITYAAAGGHEEIVKLLLINGANANCHFKYVGSPLHQAIANGHASAALAIIRYGNVNFHQTHRMTCGVEHMGYSVIAHALGNKFFDVAVGLIQAGACFRPVDSTINLSFYSNSISHLFIRGDASVAKELVLNHKSAWPDDGGIASDICEKSMPEVVLEFINGGGSLNSARYLFSRGLLSIKRKSLEDTLAVRKIFLEKICIVHPRDIGWIFPEKEWEDMRGFLECDSDINIRGALGITPLMVAAQLGDDILVGRMIEAGADITAVNDFGGTALTMAVRAANAKVMDKLLSVAKLAVFSDTVLNDDVETVREFVNLRQIDVNHAYEKGKNALMHACEKENLEMAEVLLGDMIWTFDLFNKYESPAPAGMRADINAKDVNGDTALANSCRSGKNSAVRFLLKNGADVNTINNDGDSALALCCKIGNIAGAELLLLNSANVNLQNAEGNTPLMISCFNKNTEMVNLLVSGIQRTVILFGNNGKAKNYCANLLDVDIKNNAGQTALMLSYMGESNFYIVNAVLSADPEDTGPFDVYGRKIHGDLGPFNEKDDHGYDDLAVGVKRQRTALVLEENDDELQGMDDQEEVQLLPLADFLTFHADGALDAVPHAQEEALAIASPSFADLA